VILVRFLRDSLPYMAGEVAGFLDDLARKLIDRGAAEIYVEPEIAPDVSAAQQVETKPRQRKQHQANTGA